MPSSVPSPGRGWFALRRGGRAFARNTKGTTAIEFGMLALPFFAIIGAIMETSLVFLAGQVLDSALQDASRKIRTGQAQTAGYTLTNFRAAMCDDLYSIFDCSKVRIVVTKLTDFSSVGASANAYPIKPDPCNPTTDADKCWSIAETYDPGKESDVVLVRAYYRWPTIVSIGGFNLADQLDGSRLLAAVRVFKNEPY